MSVDVEQSGPLNFVLLIDSLELPAWQLESLRSLLDSGLAQLRLVVVRTNNAQKTPVSKRGWRRIVGNKLLFWNLYSRIVVRPRCAALRPRRLDELGEFPVLTSGVLREGRFGEFLPEETVAAIRAVAPVFILRFGFGILHGAILEAAPQGVWSFHHGDPERVRGVPPGFWECNDGDFAAGVILQRLNTQLDAGSVLHRGYYRVARHSYVTTLNTLLLGAAHFPQRVCAELLASNILPRVETAQLGSIRHAPNNKQMTLFVWRQARARLANVLRFRLRRQQWNIAMVDAPIQRVAGLDQPADTTTIIRSAQWMEERNDAFCADPFAIPGEGGDSSIPVLFELYRWSKGIGTIACSHYSPDTGFGSVHEVLKRTGHLSYPFTVAHMNEPLVLPENASEGGVRAYRITPEGLHETVAMHLLPDLPLLDSTVIRWGGRWWLFASMDRYSTNTELHLFHSERLEGPWQPHALNPVKCDVRCARPAGTIFMHRGELYRPAQDCSREYGGRVIICRIDRLDTAGFGETPVSSCEPDPAGPYPQGLHTLTAAGGRTLIDGCRLTWGPSR